MKESDIDKVLQLQTKNSVLSLRPSKLKYGHDLNLRHLNLSYLKRYYCL